MTAETNQKFVRKEAEAFRIVSQGQVETVVEFVLRHGRAMRQYAERACRDGEIISVTDLVIFLRRRISEESGEGAVRKEF